MLQTNRLILRQWTDADVAAYALISRDAEVMRYFPAPYTEQRTMQLTSLWRQHIDEQGWGVWAVELRDSAEFLGSVGLDVVPFLIPGKPAGEQQIETGWRLARQFWGKGYATEAANAALDYGFRQLSLPAICAFTTVANRRSQAVMKKLHMRDSGKNFQHPNVAVESGLSEHVLYEISQTQYMQTRDWI